MPFLRVRDIQTYYEVHCPADASDPPLLFLHGLGSSLRDWAEQVAAFAGHRRVVTVDLRGHGRTSAPPGPYSIPLFAADAQDLIRQLGLAPVHVVGLSMGGMVALQLAADAPTLLRSCTVVNMGPSFQLTTPRRRLQHAARRWLIRALGMRAVGRVLSRRLFPQPEHQTTRRRFVQRWAANDKAAYLASIDGFTGWSVRDRLPAIAGPVLVLTGDQDYTPVSYKRAFARRMPRARVAVIPDARHATPVERPRLFNEALATFLRDVEDGTFEAS